MNYSAFLLAVIIWTIISRDGKGSKVELDEQDEQG